MAHHKPLVSGAAIKFDGQVTSFDLRLPKSGASDARPEQETLRSAAPSLGFRDSARDGACYHCLFPAAINNGTDQPNEGQERCATTGVFAPLVGIIGTIQAAEAIKLVTGVGTPLIGQLQMLDARTMEWQTVKYSRDPDCAVCGGRITPAVEKYAQEKKYANH